MKKDDDMQEETENKPEESPMQLEDFIPFPYR